MNHDDLLPDAVMQRVSNGEHKTLPPGFANGEQFTDALKELQETGELTPQQAVALLYRAFYGSR